MKKTTGLIFGFPIPLSGEFPEELRKRCSAGVKLYNSGVIQKIIVSGKNSSFYKSNPYMTESVLMKQYLVASGVKDLDVFEESHSSNTLENLLFTYKKYNIRKPNSYYFISSDYHMIRIRCIVFILGYRPDAKFFSVYTQSTVIKHLFSFLLIFYDLLLIMLCKIKITGKTLFIKQNIE